MKYFIRRNKNVSGPFLEDQIRTGLTNGKIKSSDLISATSNGPWRSCFEVKTHLRKGKLKGLFPPETSIEFETSRGFFSKTITVKYKCPACSIKLTNPLAEAGSNDCCPECHTTFVVPGIKEKQDQANEELNNQSSLGLGNAKKKENSIYGFEKQAHITDAPSTTRPIELPRSSESSVSCGCIGPAVLIIGFFVLFFVIPTLSDIFDETSGVSYNLSFHEWEIMIRIAGGSCVFVFLLWMFTYYLD